MKILWLFILLFLTSNISFPQYFSQSYYDFFSELYVSRQPSAKAQSMGGGLVANSDSDFGSYYNPALTSLNEGLGLNYSNSNNYKDYINPKFNYIGAIYSIEKIGTLGISRYSLKNNYFYNPQIEINKLINTLNYSREVSKNFFTGININLISSSSLEKNTLSFDLGMLIKLPVKNNSGKVNHLFQIGGAYYNLTKSAIVTDYLTGPYYFVLPSILRLGGGYNLSVKGNPVFKNTSLFNLFIHIEVEDITNGGNDAVLKVGNEITFLDIFSLRTGYYWGNTYVNKLASDFTPFTYGFGLKIPLDKILKTSFPLFVSADYVHLNQQPERDFFNEQLFLYGYYKTLGISLNLSPKF